MDKKLWIERFAARMRQNDPSMPPQLMLPLGEEVYAMGGHLSPETVARIETDIALHRLKARPGPQEHLRSRVAALVRPARPESEERVADRGHYPPGGSVCNACRTATALTDQGQQVRLVPESL